MLRYHWIKQEVTEFPTTEHPNLDYNAQRRVVELTVSLPNEPERLTVYAQYMLASMRLEQEPDAELILPVPDERVYESIARLLVPYFTEAQAIHFGGKEWPCEIRLGHPHISVMEQFEQLKQSDMLHPIVQAIFGPALDLGMEWREVQHFEIDRAALEPFYNAEFEETFDLLKGSLLTAWGQLVLNPHGWSDMDELQHNLALRFFAAYFEHLILTVQQDTGKITFLTLI